MVPPCRPFTIYTHYIGNVVQELTYQHYIVTCLFKQWIDFHTLSGEDYFANRLWFYTNAKHSCGFFLFFLSNTYVLRNSVYEICSDSMNIYSCTLIWTTNPWAEETTVLAASPNRDENENTSRRNRWALSTIDLYKSSLSKQMHCIAFFCIGGHQPDRSDPEEEESDCEGVRRLHGPHMAQLLPGLHICYRECGVLWKRHEWSQNGNIWCYSSFSNIST